MKTLITTLNSKFIHKSLALRLLYVACKNDHDIDFKEYTIKDDLNHIVDDLLSMDLDILCLSVYIWNVDHIQKLCHLLKARKPKLKKHSCLFQRKKCLSISTFSRKPCLADLEKTL